MLSNRYERVKLAQITVRHSERQRSHVDPAGLIESIKQWGVLSPIIVTRDYVLVAGGRRLAASAALGLRDIPCRFADELSVIEAQIIELEENVKREDLPWRDLISAVARLHKLYVKQDPLWSQDKTSAKLSLSPGALSEYLRVAGELNNPKIAEAGSIRAAFNVLSRSTERAIGDAMADIAEIGHTIAAPRLASGAPAPSRVVPPDESILFENFLEWAPAYAGPKFNFLHCDFPYGIEVFAGPQSGMRTHTTYDDSPEIYWALIKCLGANLDRLCTPSAHLMFWFSMENYCETLAAFAKHLPSFVVNRFPLLWHKSDNVGILPDPKRGPRRVYETALIASREDRFIIKAVGNAYAAPTNKAHHPSTKPEPVLRQFFTMFVDENTRMLDPTCGSGSSLRAAESLGARQVLGLELDKEHCDNARSALRQFRLLRSVK